MYFAYRGMNVLILAPLMALLACLFHADTPMLATLTQVYMPAVGGYIIKYLPLFMLGSIFGKLMSESGSADKIAQFVSGKLGPRHAILAVISSCAVLTYGGVSLFVVAFCMEPLAVSLFREAKLPRRFIPGAIAVGAFTFTMTALPGTPSIQNAIPMPFFGTDTFAAPILGLIASLIMGGFGTWWMISRSQKAVNKGETFVEKEKHEFIKQDNLPSVLTSFAPLLIVFIFNYAFSRHIFPAMNHDYLAEKLYGEITLDKVIGTWALVAALVIGILAIFTLHFKRFASPLQALNKGTLDCMLPVFNTASEVGYGNTIAVLSSFALIKSGVLSLSGSNPLVSEAIAVNVLAGITGSASGGLSIALGALGKTYLELAQTAGISPELLHRVGSIASGGFDTLPHNGAVITLLAICGMDHKRSYFDIFMVAVVFPFAATIAVVGLGTMFGSF
ncbi:MAG: GntP family permease [Bacteriovoracaceae bacterium]|nr:GntP family permease [Bacteriovoracaceae bacterium]